MMNETKPKGKITLKTLPKFVRDPANYSAIQKALFDALQSTHSHAEVMDWFKCFACQQKVKDHKELMQKFGFTAPGMYVVWKKRQEERIKEKIKRKL